jgi:hypothetical protein
MAHRLESLVGFSSKDSGCGLNQGEGEPFKHGCQSSASALSGHFPIVMNTQLHGFVLIVWKRKRKWADRADGLINFKRGFQFYASNATDALAADAWPGWF